MLKKIEIFGFKSFAEKTTIILDDVISGIVGPNGAGKSNIVDAIKWCLGEQSLKEIRAKNYIDLIFSGSESKPPLNYCEVTLTFDNQKKYFPIEYEEVSITRKIYRNGEVEYFINKNPVRLKDIKDLVLDTGLSSNGYGIIPQGEIEFIVSSKPEERRLIFEETAGIAKYKFKREEALRKLERVKLDMARVDDILSYIKEQMSSLEQAVKKAKNYQKYKYELQMLECANIVNNINSIEEELKKIETSYLDLYNRYTPLVTEISQNESEIINIKLKIAEFEKNFIILKDELSKVETEISVTTQRIENYKNEIIKSEEQINKINRQIEELAIKNDNYQQEIKDLVSKEENFKSQISSLFDKKSNYETKYSKYKNDINNKQEILKGKNNLLSEISYKRSKIRNDLLLVSKELQQLNIELNDINKDIQLNNKEKQDLENSLNDIVKNLLELENSKKIIIEKLDLIKREINKIEKQIEEKKILYDNKNKEFYFLSSKIENFKNDFYVNILKIKKFLEENNLADCCIPVYSLLEISNDYNHIISTFLGNRLFWYVVDKEQDAMKIAEFIKNNNLGFITFIIKEKIDKLDDNKFGMLDDKIFNIITFKSSFEKVIKFLFSDIKILENELITNDFLLHTGRLDFKNDIDNFYTYESKLSNISKELKFINKEIQDLNLSYKELINRYNSLERELISVNTHIDQLNKIKLEKEEYLSSIKELETVLNSNLDIKNKQISHLEEQIININLEIKNLDEQEKYLREEINNLVSELSLLQSNKVIEEYLKISSDYARFEEQYNSLLSEIEIKKNIININKTKIESFQEEIEEIKNFIIETKQNILTEENKLEEFLKNKQTISEKIFFVNSELQKNKELLINLEKKNKEFLTQKEELQNQINEIEIQKNVLKNKKLNFLNLLNEKYSISLKEAQELYGDIKEIDLQQIEKLKKKLDSMGLINLAAPEEYAQLEEKYNVLVNQQQDLIKSQQDIKDAILKINQQISLSFKETFNKVKENFIKLCKILFEGGNADLVLTNPDNLLESGIEIFVQPPGKKNQNINLLSGGEKSLVAFALLFSFFMVKPSPVCILDEADAQLDETNVVRFMKLLREFSKDTKFIVITHNTRTMEFLDTLYGITMEELGVSKVIAIKLHKLKVSV